MQEFKDNLTDETLKEKYESQGFKRIEPLWFNWEKKIKISDLQRALERVVDLEGINDHVLKFMGIFLPSRLNDDDSKWQKIDQLNSI